MVDSNLTSFYSEFVDKTLQDSHDFLQGSPEDLQLDHEPNFQRSMQSGIKHLDLIVREGNGKARELSKEPCLRLPMYIPSVNAGHVMKERQASAGKRLST